MKQILLCTNCKRAVSKPVQILVDGTPDNPNVSWDDECELTPSGIAFKTHLRFPAHVSPVEKAHLLEFSPMFLLRPDDLDPIVKNTEDSSRLNGCCGLDGCDGLNKKCQCGAYIGTEKSDCWTPKVFITENAATHWQNVEKTAQNDD